MVIRNCRGVCVPIGLTAEQRLALIDRVRMALASPSWNASLAQHRWMSEPLLGEPFEAFVAAEFESMRAVLVKAGLG